jgi:hypothetical protein
MINNPSGQHGITNYGGTLDLGNYCGGSCVPSNIAEGSGKDWQANNTYSGVTYDYDYWVNHLSSETKTNFAGGSMAGLSGLYNLTGTTISGNIGTNKVVILKDGNITINGNISVSQGGFLMVVASGTITVSNALGGTSANPAVQGIFTANVINFGTGSVQLFAGGTFIGWTNLELVGRDFNDSRNRTLPILSFSFRPDFIINAPDYIKKVSYPRWEQVPG